MGKFSPNVMPNPERGMGWKVHEHVDKDTLGDMVEATYRNPVESKAIMAPVKKECGTCPHNMECMIPTGTVKARDAWSTCYRYTGN